MKGEEEVFFCFVLKQYLNGQNFTFNFSVYGQDILLKFFM